MKLENTKVHVKNKEESAAVQKKMFKLGYSWLGDIDIENSDAPYLYFDTDGDIMYEIDKEKFNESDEYRKVTVKQIMDIKVTKKKATGKVPKFLVAWEEDEDPCKFFFTKKEAEEHIHKLMEDDDVQQDSIIFAELKAVKKVDVKKAFGYSEYRI